MDHLRHLYFVQVIRMWFVRSYGGWGLVQLTRLFFALGTLVFVGLTLYTDNGNYALAAFLLCAFAVLIPPNN